MVLGAIVLDSNDSETLSDFYASLLGWTKERYSPEWVIVKSDDGAGTPLVFQETAKYERPVWPAQTGGQQQMLHLDFYVDSVDAGVEHAINCGATLSEVQLERDWKVLLDPAGHPFCILPNKAPE
ncbi:MAG: hypothetical protein LBV27_02590 [Oscillospiraceae bacterium]|jgi:catechol 2,3-dioxygenase-like lactoylglutathione lyase family enzyme|nr:hypothetical protein [Oscillospiraceae bacterium]